MPKITKGGVSDVTVDPDFIAAPGTDPATALDTGQENMAGEEAEQRRQERIEQEQADAEPAEEEQEESPSPGKTSSPESKKPKQTTPKQSDAAPSPLTAPSTAGRSRSARTE